jgi:GntR family transcriptional regulator
VPLTTDDARPPYLQLADLIRAEIESGKYQPGSKLPTYRELADEHGVATMTVQSAFRVLKDAGLISSQQGRGSFVRSDKTSAAAEPHGTPGEQDAIVRVEAALARLEERVAALEADRRR